MTQPADASRNRAVSPSPQSAESGGGRSRAESVVSCDRLTKCYGDFQALVDCTLEVRRGDVFGLLGPNGAGKTTLIRSLLGFLKTTRGRALVCGSDPQVDSVGVRRKVAYLPGDARLPRHMRGDGVLRFFAELHPLGDLKRSREIADALELDTRRHVGMMSTGMRQKLALAVVLAPATPLLILDEPTANLDPSVRATVLELVLDAHARGRTVILSSHVLSEIEDTCNRVAFLRRGKLALELEMAELFQRHRIWADLPQTIEPDAAQQNASQQDTSNQGVAFLEDRIPPQFRDQVRIVAFSSQHHPGTRSIRMETSGDLAPMLDWIGTLGLQRMRIEPLGLRSVYDSVHRDAFRDPRLEPLEAVDLAASREDDGVSV